MSSKRRLARELALQILYQSELSKEECSRLLPSFWENNPVDEGTKEFAEQLVLGVSSQKTEIDLLICRVSDNWKIDRISAIDRNILRFAIFEILFLDNIPTPVTINEAIEIAKKFSTADSGKFVNGILDKINKEESPAEQI